MTKKKLAKKLDKENPLYNFNVETGPTSYRRYSKKELIRIMVETLDKKYENK